jgi:flagellar hook protein FlgE
MILGQRAYEANSKVIKTADDMLQQINNLTR